MDAKNNYKVKYNPILDDIYVEYFYYYYKHGYIVYSEISTEDAKAKFNNTK